jgi:hypothetical protein
MPRKARCNEISDDYMHGGAVGWEFVNYDTVQSGWHGVGPRPAWPNGYLQMTRGSWRLPEFAETPRFLIDRKHGRPPRDLESTDDVFLVSPAMKAVLEAVDPDACEFVCCETVLPSGGRGSETWLCVITRAFAGAVDEQASVKLCLLRSERKGRMQDCGTNRYSVPADEQVAWGGLSQDRRGAGA